MKNKFEFYIYSLEKHFKLNFFIKYYIFTYLKEFTYYKV